MKKMIIILIVAAAVVAGILADKSNDPGPELEVVCYFRSLFLPAWTPLSMGYYPGSP